MVYYARERLFLEILLTEGKPDVALNRVDSLHVVRMPSKGYPRLIWYNLPFRDDIIPRVYLANANIDEAIEAYERMTTIDPKGSTDRRIIPPWYHYKLARLYEQNDQIEEAIDRYRHFLKVWEKADDDLLEKIDAQKRLAALINPKSKN
jgi:tetratricopeptide (TPR) repeat protein